ncbi:MAG: hypothetical protein P4L85_14030 [Paludisphaera borealis]|uniref:hypothetical protein n=1 Tax=Paludisphaera borealis TaxID=1387353 RepID=UPI00284BD0CE|nr:hypothetical protein [Paludisphaera borealis]MDR3620465.1 hypothetical protein [Paludisphaera borealis]
MWKSLERIGEWLGLRDAGPDISRDLRWGCEVPDSEREQDRLWAEEHAAEREKAMGEELEGERHGLADWNAEWEEAEWRRLQIEYEELKPQWERERLAEDEALDRALDLMEYEGIKEYEERPPGWMPNEFQIANAVWQIECRTEKQFYVSQDGKSLSTFSIPDFTAREWSELSDEHKLRAIDKPSVSWRGFSPEQRSRVQSNVLEELPTSEWMTGVEPVPPRPEPTPPEI